MLLPDGDRAYVDRLKPIPTDVPRQALHAFGLKIEQREVLAEALRVKSAQWQGLDCVRTAEDAGRQSADGAYGLDRRS